MATTNDFQNTDLLQIFEALGGGATPATDLLQKIFYQVSAKTNVIDYGLTATAKDAYINADAWQSGNPDKRIINILVTPENGGGYRLAIIYETRII
jgi:hypothetical protein